MATQPQGGSFNRPDVRPFVPKGMEDTVARVSAAGQKLMYSPKMRDELVQAVQSQDPVPKKLAESVVGLMLTLDQQTKGGGIPEAALFPAALDLLGEAADALIKAGQSVTQDDYNEAARMMFVLMAKKLGIPDDKIMGAASQAAGGAAPDDEAAEPTPDDEAAEGETADSPAKETGEAPGAPDEEEQAMQQGFTR